LVQIASKRGSSNRSSLPEVSLWRSPNALKLSERFRQFFGKIIAVGLEEIDDGIWSLVGAPA